MLLKHVAETKNVAISKNERKWQNLALLLSFNDSLNKNDFLK